MEMYTNIPINDPSIPTISLQAFSGLCSIVGNSFMENPREFYQPVIKWIEENNSNFHRDLIWHIRLDYYNSASKKMFSKILKNLNNNQHNQGRVTINWYYKKGDDDMIEDVKDLMEVSNIPIRLIAYEDLF